MRIDVFSVFPGLVASYCDEALLGKSQAHGLWELRTHDLRSGATDKHRSVDDASFGGGPGMVMAPEPVFRAVESVPDAPRPLYLLSPGGRTFTQEVAHELSELSGFSLLCARYEGVDQRVTDHLCDGEISLGDFVIAGGEVAALVVIEAVVRLIPGVMGNPSSAESESHQEGLLEYPQYTRPAQFRKWDVPPVLLSGNHERIDRWRQAAALHRTRTARPDLLAARGGLTENELALLEEFGFPKS